MPGKILNSKKQKESLDHVYADDEISDLKRISIPSIIKINKANIKKIISIIAIIFVCAIFYAIFLKHESKDSLRQDTPWYIVKLADKDIYYGQIVDLSSEPVVVNNVYYNYDQAKTKNNSEEVKNETEIGGNIKLVKRGKEAYGPTGTMNIYRAQILYIEPLSENSKVLKAILEYEK